MAAWVCAELASSEGYQGGEPLMSCQRHQVPRLTQRRAQPGIGHDVAARARGGDEDPHAAPAFDSLRSLAWLLIKLNRTVNVLAVVPPDGHGWGASVSSRSGGYGSPVTSFQVVKRMAISRRYWSARSR